MLSLAKGTAESTAAATRYFLSLSRYYLGRRRKRRTSDDDQHDDGFGPDDQNEPYSIPGEPPGRWFGKAAWRFGLTGVVEELPFARLMDGLHPITSEPLTQNSGRHGRIRYFDLTFSAPKSVSIAWMLASPPLRNRIKAQHDAAVKATMQYFERNLAWCRTGQQGFGPSQQAEIVAALFNHHTNRSEEPQIHTHAVLMNVGRCNDGNHRALDGRPVYGLKMFLGAYYRAHIAAGLRHNCGLVAERYGNSFELKGIPSEIRQLFSTPRKKILQELLASGQATSEAAQIAALRIRKKKKETLEPIADKIRLWQEFAKQHGITERNLNKIISQNQINSKKYISKAIKATFADLLKNKQHFTHLEFLTHALYAATKYAIPPEALLEAAEQAFLTTDMLRLPALFGPQLYTTKEAYALEVKLFDLLEKLRQSPALQIDPGRVYNAIASVEKKLGYKLRKEQRHAVRHATQSPGGIRCINGAPGTGKTTATLLPPILAFKELGYDVIGTALAANAAKTLAEKTGIQTYTLAKLLANWKPPLRQRIKQEAQLAIRQITAPPQPATFTKAMKQAAKNRRKRRPRRHRFKPLKISKPGKTVLILDEASMLSVKQWTELATYADKHRLILLTTGDGHQLGPPTGKPAYKSICNFVGNATLTQTSRQQESWQQQASRHFHAHEFGKGLQLYASSGHVHTRENIDDTLAAAVNHWQQLRGHVFPGEVVLIPHTNKHVDHLNAACQKLRLKAGLLRGFPEKITHQTSSGDHHVEHVYRGDPVMFTQGSSHHDFENGERGTVVEIKHIGKGYRPTIDVLLESGHGVTITPATFPGIRLAYAATNYKLQGQTLKHVIAIAGGRMQNAPGTVVQATRHQLSLDFFTTKHLVPDISKISTSPLAEIMKRKPEDRLIRDILNEYKVAIEPDRPKRIEKCLYDYFMLCGSDPQRAAIITHSEAEAKAINQEIQHQRTEAIRKVPNATVVALPTKDTDGSNTTYIVGDRVRMKTTANAYEKGQLGTISNIMPGEHAILLIEFDNDTFAHLPLDNRTSQNHHEILEHAYAITPEQATGLKLLTAFELPPDPPSRKVLRYHKDTFRLGDHIRFTGDHRAPSLQPNTGHILATANQRATLVDIDSRQSLLTLKTDSGQSISILVNESKPPPIEKLATNWQELLAKNPRLSPEELQLRTTRAAFDAYVAHQESRRKQAAKLKRITQKANRQRKELKRLAAEQHRIASQLAPLPPTERKQQPATERQQRPTLTPPQPIQSAPALTSYDLSGPTTFLGYEVGSAFSFCETETPTTNPYELLPGYDVLVVKEITTNCLFAQHEQTSDVFLFVADQLANTVKLSPNWNALTTDEQHNRIYEHTGFDYKDLIDNQEFTRQRRLSEAYRPGHFAYQAGDVLCFAESIRFQHGNMNKIARYGYRAEVLAVNKDSVHVRFADGFESSLRPRELTATRLLTTDAWSELTLHQQQLLYDAVLPGHEQHYAARQQNCTFPESTCEGYRLGDTLCFIGQPRFASYYPEAGNHAKVIRLGTSSLDVQFPDGLELTLHRNHLQQTRLLSENWNDLDFKQRQTIYDQVLPNLRQHFKVGSAVCFTHSLKVKSNTASTVTIKYGDPAVITAIHADSISVRLDNRNYLELTIPRSDFYDVKKMSDNWTKLTAEQQLDVYDRCVPGFRAANRKEYNDAVKRNAEMQAQHEALLAEQQRLQRQRELDEQTERQQYELYRQQINEIPFTPSPTFETVYAVNPPSLADSILPMSHHQQPNYSAENTYRYTAPETQPYISAPVGAMQDSWHKNQDVQISHTLTSWTSVSTTYRTAN